MGLYVFKSRPTHFIRCIRNGRLLKSLPGTLFRQRQFFRWFLCGAVASGNAISSVKLRASQHYCDLPRL